MRSLLTLFALLTLGLGCEAATPTAGSAFEALIPQQEEAIQKGLAWLAKHQGKEGAWGNQGPSGSYPMAMTGLAGMAFLSTGVVPDRGRYGRNVSRALKWILKNQGRDGLLAEAGDGQSMHGHGFALTFLAEAYGMDVHGTEAETYKAALVNAVKLIARAQSAWGGWYYSPDSGSDEGSVTITQVQALRACANVGIPIPPNVMKNALSYIHKAQNSDGGIRYSARSGGSSSLALSAAGAELLLMAGQYDAPQTQKVIAYLKVNLKVSATRDYHQFYTSFYGAQSMAQIGGTLWERYYEDLRKSLLSSQRSDGSWTDNVGEAYATAIGVTVLALPYNYLPLFQK